MSEEVSQPHTAASPGTVVQTIAPAAPLNTGRPWWADPKTLLIAVLLGGGGMGSAGTLFAKNGSDDRRVEKLEEKFEAYQNTQRARDARLDDRLRKIEIDTAKILGKLEDL